MKITEKIFDITTNKETITERDETATEMATREKDKAALAALLKAQEKLANDKAALLIKLGITADEAKLLLS